MRMIGLSISCFLFVSSLLFCIGASTRYAVGDGFPSCSNGHPGSQQARWLIKTSLQSGTNVDTPVPLDSSSMVDAPDLLLNSDDTKKIGLSVVRVRGVWASRNYTRALLQGGPSPSPNAVFSFKLPAFSYSAFLAARAAAPPEERPTHLGFLVASRFQDQVIPFPVTVGAREVKEGEIVSVDAYVYAAGCERDRDFHFDLTSGTSPNGCFIAEVPLPEFIPSSRLRQLVAAARSEGAGVRVGDHVQLTGQFFYDAWHMPSTQADLNANPGGGRGAGHCAATLWEIHPVISIRKI